MIKPMKKAKTIHDNRYRTLISELARERIRLSLSQEELAEQVGLNQSDISKIEKFEKRLDILEFSLILNSLRITENFQLQRTVKEFMGLTK